MVAISVFDETIPGKKTRVLTLESMEARISVRDLIRMRIYEEVQDFNRSKKETFNGLVQPTDTEKTLNGYKLKKNRVVSFQEQFEKAVEAFKRDGFLILVDNRQVTELDDAIDLGADTEVSFVKLVPLVGG